MSPLRNSDIEYLLEVSQKLQEISARIRRQVHAQAILLKGIYELNRQTLEANRLMQLDHNDIQPKS